MEAIVTQENLAFALASTNRVASSKAGLPILNNILLRTDGNRLLIAATNLEISTSHRIGAKVVKPGSITVPSKLISEFVQNLSREQITLKVTNNKLHIQSSSSKSIINGISDDEFPELPVIEDKAAATYTLTAQDFKQSVSQTIIAASNDSTRPVLTGVFWHSHDGYLYIAATDGYRLAERKIIKTASDVSAIIPATTLQEVLRTLRDDTSEIQILLDDTQVSFKVDDVEITSRLIDGNFPDYRQLIPASSDTSFELPRSEFVRVIKIAGLFARESGGGIILSVDIEKKHVSVNSVASEIGENNSEVDAKTGGADGGVSLNSRYVLDALSTMSHDAIRFEFSGKLSPCIMTEVTKDVPYKHIIMPLKS